MWGNHPPYEVGKPYTYPVGTGVQEKDPDLAVLPAPSCPAVLPRYSRRLLPFLDEARFIHHQDPVCLSQLLDHVGLQFIAHRLLIPVRFLQQPLHPVGVRFSQFLSHLPAVLALHRREQPLQVAPNALSHLGTSKMRPDPTRQLCQHVGSLADDAPFSLHRARFWLRFLFWTHSLSPPHPFYHVSSLNGAVVLEAV